MGGVGSRCKRSGAKAAGPGRAELRGGEELPADARSKAWEGGGGPGGSRVNVHEDRSGLARGEGRGGALGRCSTLSRVEIQP